MSEEAAHVDGSGVFIVGATGIAGRLIAAELLRRGVRVTIAGRDPQKVEQVARGLALETGTRPGVGAWPVSEFDSGIGVVVNAAGPSTITAPAVLAAAFAGGVHYVDIADDLPSVLAVLDVADDAQAHGVSVVTAAGFGATAVEAVVLDAMAQVTGPVRSAQVAAMSVSRFETAGVNQTVLEALPNGFRVYRDGRITSITPGSHQTKVTIGSMTKTMLPVPVGELVATRRATQAPDITAYSSELPSGPISRVALPLARAVLSIGPVRRRVVRSAGRKPVKDVPVEGAYPSSAWARITAESRQVVEVVWEFPEGYDYTASAVAETVTRLLRGEGRPGAWTPGELFGSTVARAAGGRPRPLASVPR